MLLLLCAGGGGRHRSTETTRVGATDKNNTHERMSSTAGHPALCAEVENIPSPWKIWRTPTNPVPSAATTTDDGQERMAHRPHGAGRRVSRLTGSQASVSTGRKRRIHLGRARPSGRPRRRASSRPGLDSRRRGERARRVRFPGQPWQVDQQIKSESKPNRSTQPGYQPGDSTRLFGQFQADTTRISRRSQAYPPQTGVPTSPDPNTPT
jgi:hypothetical protein